MANQKGSIRNRIRYWATMRSRKKKEREKQEQEAWNTYLEEKRKQGIFIQPVTKKYHVITIFFHSLFGLFFGLFEPKKKTITNRQLLENIVQLQKEIEQNQALQIPNTYHQRVEQQEKQLQQVIQRQQKEEQDFIIQECIERLYVVKSKLHNQELEHHKMEHSVVSKTENKENKVQAELVIEQSVQNKEFVKEEISPIQQTMPYSPPTSIPLQSQLLEEPEIKLVQKEKPEEKVIKTEEQDIKKKESEPIDVVPIEETVQIEIREEKKDYQEYLFDLNTKLKKQQESLKVCKEKVKQAKTPKELYQIESTILWIQNQLLQLESRYKEIAKERQFQYLKHEVACYTVDTFDLLKSNQAIQNLVDDCKKIVAEIEEKAMIKPVAQKGIEKRKEKKEKKEEKKEEKKQEQFYLDIKDFEQLRLQVQEDLERQLEHVKEIQQIPITRPSFFEKLFKFVSHTALLLTPMVFFKNKLTGMLASSILLSNRVQSMRRLVEQKETMYETGENLMMQIRSKQDCIEAIHSRFQNSLFEIAQLKQSFLTKYQNAFPIETAQFFNQLDALESQIIEKTAALDIDQRRLLQMKRNYQKVLKK